MKAILTVCVATLLLTGCGTLINPYHEEFTCKASSDGGACVDTMTAYADAQATQSADNKPLTPSVIPPGGISSLPATSRAVYEDRYYRRLAGMLEEPQVPMMEPPKIMRVLLMPYKGEGGELFMPRYSFVKVEEARWILAEDQASR